MTRLFGSYVETDLSRIQKKKFWSRWIVGFVIGHSAGALGFAAVLVGFYKASPQRDDFKTAEPLTSWHQIAWLPFEHVITTTSMFAPVFVLMAPLSIIVSPVAFLAAAILRTNRLWTMLLGAIIGVALGWPLSRVIYGGLIGAEWTWAACSAGAGALFALSVWHFSIKPWTGRSEVSASPVLAAERKLNPVMVAALALLILVGLMFGI